MDDPHEAEDPRAKYWDWITANEDKILDKYFESEHCWERATQLAVEDCATNGDDVDVIERYIQRFNLKDVPDDFVESIYEQSFSYSDDEIYERKRDLEL